MTAQGILCMARLIRFNGQIEDDRGASHPRSAVTIEDRVSFRLRGRSFIDSIEDQPGVDPVQLSARIHRRVLGSCGPPPERTWWYWASFAFMVALLEGMALLANLQGWERLLYLSPLIFVGVWTAAIPLDRAMRRRDIARLHTLPPVCLACVYDLTGVPPDSDGCTVCPECGAAWKLTPRSPENAMGEEA